ncbi:MAG: geranylgeranyl reductase family protein [Thermoplasmata archaeon]
MEVDVLIVGAGPAGSTTARFCADRSLDVLMIDRRKEIGVPVQCGEFLPSAKEMYSMFPRTMDLEELMDVHGDLVVGEADHVDFISPGGRAYRCDFSGSILDRKAFDKHLAKLAIEAGARLETNASLLSMRDGIARTTLGDIRAKVVVGADGPNSRTASQVGLRRPAQRFPAITCQAEGSFEPVVKMFFGSIAPGGYAWIIPKRRGANVGIGINPEVPHDPPSTHFRRFVFRLGCRYSDVAMKFVPMGGPIPQTVKGNVVLVGDSAGHVMPTNGGGIPIAMIAGRIAGQTIKEHIRQGARLLEYENRWRAVLGKPLKKALGTRRLADMVLPYDRLLGMAMAVLGRRGLDRAIRCQRIIF